jgi:hypothetical protein
MTIKLDFELRIYDQLNYNQDPERGFDVSRIRAMSGSLK